MPTQTGPFDLPWGEINHPTVFYLLNSFLSNDEAVAIRHPKATISCRDKLEMFAEYRERYVPYGDLRVAQGTVLLVKRRGEKTAVLYVSDADSRINWKAMKHELHLGKKDDVRMHDGDVSEIVGLPLGGISPFVAPHHTLERIIFDRDLRALEDSCPTTRWDFAFGLDVSVLIRPKALFNALIRLNTPAGAILSWSPIH